MFNRIKTLYYELYQVSNLTNGFGLTTLLPPPNNGSCWNRNERTQPYSGNKWPTEGFTRRKSSEGYSSLMSWRFFQPLLLLYLVQPRYESSEYGGQPSSWFQVAITSYVVNYWYSLYYFMLRTIAFDIDFFITDEGNVESMLYCWWIFPRTPSLPAQYWESPTI